MTTPDCCIRCGEDPNECKRTRTSCPKWSLWFSIEWKKIRRYSEYLKHKEEKHETKEQARPTAELSTKASANQDKPVGSERPLLTRTVDEKGRV